MSYLMKKLNEISNLKKLCRGNNGTSATSGTSFEVEGTTDSSIIKTKPILKL